MALFGRGGEWFTIVAEVGNGAPYVNEEAEAQRCLLWPVSFPDRYMGLSWQTLLTGRMTDESSGTPSTNAFRSCWQTPSAYSREITMFEILAAPWNMQKVLSTSVYLAYGGFELWICYMSLLSLTDSNLVQVGRGPIGFQDRTDTVKLGHSAGDLIKRQNIARLLQYYSFAHMQLSDT